MTGKHASHLVVDDIARDPGDLVRPGTRGGKCTAEVGVHLQRLSRKIATANEVAAYVFGLLPAMNTNLLPVAMTTCVYVCCGGRSAGATAATP
jgi:hypothetical protein